MTISTPTPSVSTTLTSIQELLASQTKHPRITPQIDQNGNAVDQDGPTITGPLANPPNTGTHLSEVA